MQIFILKEAQLSLPTYMKFRFRNENLDLFVIYPRLVYRLFH